MLIFKKYLVFAVFISMALAILAVSFTKTSFDDLDNNLPMSQQAVIWTKTNSLKKINLFPFKTSLQ